MIQNLHLGGWVINENPVEIEDEAREVFLKSTQFFAGSDFELCLHLGTQLVSGKNYAFICRRQSVTLNPQVAYSLVICYVNQGKYSISRIKDIVQEGELPLGGIHCVKTSQALITKIDSIEADNIIKSFNQAFENIKGVVYTPELLMAIQITSGPNYHLIAKAKTMDKEQTTDFRYIVINRFMNESKIIKIEHL